MYLYTAYVEIKYTSRQEMIPDKEIKKKLGIKFFDLKLTFRENRF